MTENFKNFDESDGQQFCEKGEAAMVGDVAMDVDARIVDLQAKLESQTDLYVRALADLDNFRKRMQKDREEIRTIITSAIIEDILPVLDHFELGLQSAESHRATEILEGFTMVFDQLKRILISYGLSEVVPRDQEFDPHEHECVRREYADTVRENIVICVVRKGYKLNNRLIRPAVVVVSTKQRPEAHE
ncbi:MAG: nucleotide exchange factor GrpE [Puniceicoccales bacterium]|nr:nucleotide exchange factor GrpE [Puniceicoccales bacterium]